MAVIDQKRTSPTTMFPKHPFETDEDASLRVFEYHARAAPLVIPIVFLCVAVLMWWSPPSVWFVLFNLLGGIGLATSWNYRMKGNVEGALFAALFFVLATLCGLWLDHKRNFSLQFVQGLGLWTLPLYVFAFACRRKLPAK